MDSSAGYVAYAFSIAILVLYILEITKSKPVPEPYTVLPEWRIDTGSGNLVNLTGSDGLNMVWIQGSNPNNTSLTLAPASQTIGFLTNTENSISELQRLVGQTFRMTIINNSGYVLKILPGLGDDISGISPSTLSNGTANVALVSLVSYDPASVSYAWI